MQLNQMAGLQCRWIAECVSVVTNPIVGVWAADFGEKKKTSD
jgi:hypothetical protein